MPNGGAARLADHPDMRVAAARGEGGGCGVSSYTKWDRAGYIERACGAEKAEQRRKELMAGAKWVPAR